MGQSILLVIERKKGVGSYLDGDGNVEQIHRPSRHLKRVFCTSLLERAQEGHPVKPWRFEIPHRTFLGKLCCHPRTHHFGTPQLGPAVGRRCGNFHTEANLPPTGESVKASRRAAAR